MQATIVDLRYHMRQVLEALNRNEEVTVLYHGKKIAEIVPTRHTKKKISIKEHPFFGMSKTDPTSVANQMKQLRGGRYRDI